jgi:hypothetical protein
VEQSRVPLLSAHTLSTARPCVGTVVLPARIIKLAVEMQFGLMARAQS